ncbi:hypothetical protein [Teredinibacter purpureus]|uniref:hypothetical protein n=1 Tax=Teredinibacter purpureus TaxID=2731756 RepID=UPI0005F88401|nr:hypothetical protein [Teredinibacter purpureus]
MNRINIAEAIHSLEELLAALNNAYWETSDIHRKDCMFDLVTTLFGELNELAKLSISDHAMTYEPVTSAFHSSNANLRQIQNNIEKWFPRTTTAKQLQTAIPPVVNLFEFN